MKKTIALIGNPNCGKTTLFNLLTGSKQKIGNWAGVTVEKKTGKMKIGKDEYEVIDLPGIYSFSAYSDDERVARDYILDEKPDVVVNILDASNLERSLYLTTQLIEMQQNTVVAMNMVDVAKKNRIDIETKHLERHIDFPIQPIVAKNKKGIDKLIQQIVEHTKNPHISKTEVYYDSIVEEEIDKLNKILLPIAKKEKLDARWFSIKALEKTRKADLLLDDSHKKVVNKSIRRIEKHTGDESDFVIADGRYGFIHGLAKDVVNRENMVKKKVSDVIDSFTLNRYLGIPIFLIIMYFVFLLTINVGTPFIDFFDILAGTIFVEGFGKLLTNLNFPIWLVTFLADGLGGAVQTVATFIPPIFFIFLSLSFLEDSGYISRAAFIMDKHMRKIGLPGKAFIPLLVGFGCTVPAVMSARTIENKKDKILTILITPLMSCGARLPVYTILAAAFFSHQGGIIIFALYLIGIILAVFSGFLFKKTLFEGETSTFVMELPSYHIPTLNGVLTHTWNRLKGFILRAGQAILIAVIVLSVLNSVNFKGEIGNIDSRDSVLSSIGRSITPIFEPMGIKEENWQATVGLFTGLFAKEAVIGALEALYEEENTGEENEFNFWRGIEDAFLAIPAGFDGFLQNITDPLGVFSAAESSKNIEKSSFVKALHKNFGSKKSAFAYMLFILIYAPCVAAIGAVYAETNAFWATLSTVYLTLLAWITSTLFYQTATFFSHPTISLIWIISLVLSLGAIYFLLKKLKRVV